MLILVIDKKITWANVDPVLCREMASLGLNLILMEILTPVYYDKCLAT